MLWLPRTVSSPGEHSAGTGTGCFQGLADTLAIARR